MNKIKINRTLQTEQKALISVQKNRCSTKKLFCITLVSPVVTILKKHKEDFILIKLKFIKKITPHVFFKDFDYKHFCGTGFSEYLAVNAFEETNPAFRQT